MDKQRKCPIWFNHHNPECRQDECQWWNFCSGGFLFDIAAFLYDILNEGRNNGKD